MSTSAKGNPPDSVEAFPATPDESSEFAKDRSGVLSPEDAVSQISPTVLLSDLRLASAAYQDFCKRRTDGDAAPGDAWCASVSCRPEFANLYREIDRADPAAASRFAQAITAMPQAGSDFLGFRLVSELGHGAFARVFLALQRQLAERPVVLKISAEASEETQNLAQLQHTNIVPIYSVHYAQPFQAVCMPYFGATTLLDVHKYLKGLPRLPDSGKGLVSTFNAHRNTTHRNGAAGSRNGIPPIRVAQVNTAAGNTEAVSKDAQAEVPHTLTLLEKFTYVEAVIWLGARLADGLAHAHERGIYHRDLKPANILLTDEGQPMLLDFNLSEDSKIRSSAQAAVIGGTLPYMAPEQLAAFVGSAKPVDGRGDVYALGIVLYELLTRRHPFAPLKGPMQAAIPDMIAERLKPPPRVRSWNKTVPPAVESIIRHSLEGDAARRYQSARELQEDLQRLLDHRPLRFAPDPSLWHRGRRWLRRHPVITRSATVGAIVLLVALGAGLTVQARQEQQRRQAVAQLQEFRASKRSAEYPLLIRRDTPALRGIGLHECGRVLDRYQVFDNPKWRELPAVRSLPPEQAERLREEIGELLLLYVRNLLPDTLTRRDADERDKELREALRLNERAEACFSPDQTPTFVWKQRAELYLALKNKDEAERYGKLSKGPPRSLLDQYLNGLDLLAKDRWHDALVQFRAVTQRAPDHYWAWFMQGICADHLGDYPSAVGYFTVCGVLWPENGLAYFNRCAMRLHMKDWNQARQDANKALELCEDRELQADLYFNRAVAEEGLGHDHEAIRDYTQALAMGAAYTRIFFARAEARQRVGQYDEAKRDRQDGLRRRPTDSLSWTTRGLYELDLNPPQLRGAVEDFREALKVNRKNLRAWQNAAHTLSIMGEAAECIRCLTKALDFYPRVKEFRSGRGIELARVGRRDEAYRDAVESLRNAPSARITYQVAGIYALISQQNPAERDKALLLVSAAIGPGFGISHVAPLSAIYDHEARALRSQTIQLATLAVQPRGILNRAAAMHTLLSERNGADRRKALELLAEAIQKGFGANELEVDPDLNPIRDRPEFCALLRAVRELKTAVGYVK